MNQDIGELKGDNGEKVSDLSERIGRILHPKTKPPYMASSYIATPNDEIFSGIIDYIRQKIEWISDRKYELDVEKNMNIRPIILKKFQQEFRKDTFESLVVQTEGFEKIRDVKEGYYRVGHNYDQLITDGSKEFLTKNNLMKKILVINHIGISEGMDAYYNAIQTASNSQFLCFLYILI